MNGPGHCCRLLRCDPSIAARRPQRLPSPPVGSGCLRRPRHYPDELGSSTRPHLIPRRPCARAHRAPAPGRGCRPQTGRTCRRAVASGVSAETLRAIARDVSAETLAHSALAARTTVFEIRGRADEPRSVRPKMTGYGPSSGLRCRTVRRGLRSVSGRARRRARGGGRVRALRILPVAVMGRLSRNSTRRGYLQAAMFRRTRRRGPPR